MDEIVRQPVFFNNIEIWAPVTIDGVKPGLYEVSTFGRVRNNKGIFLKPMLINTGYYVYRLFTGNPDHRYKSILVHRLVMETFFPIDNMNKMTVNHDSGDKLNNNGFNLEWQTQSQNNEHARRNGLNTNFGTGHYMSKLNEYQVRRTCELLEKGIPYKDIIIDIGLDPNLDLNYDIIGNIKRRITYKNISKDYNF